ncbi:DUF3291 domain-containing protein [Larkinella soli]|uniref:DUF3291 domain-containing protein n=1 Tax=Larkinella soli TaxID=1770527 RepID=UPI000FFB970E|nr:DUF3291 domain-containing protein [Larkinella soli]
MAIVTVTVLRYPAGRRYRAFVRMGRWMMNPFSAPGLRFQKMMGTGKEFGLIPDFSRYVFLGVWTSEEAAHTFFASAEWKAMSDGTAEAGTLYLKPLRSHGRWDGKDPFAEEEKASAQPPGREGLSGHPVAVLTRATLRWTALPDFWRHVPQARKQLSAGADHLLFAVGAGEKPLVQQCTISVWTDARAIDQFAYRQSGHKEVVRRTRERRWYAEELFARFAVLRSEGTFSGKPLAWPKAFGAEIPG